MSSEEREDLEAVRRRMLSPRRIAIQVIGFVIGAVLVGWCVKVAFFGDTDWSKIRSASPWMIAALLGTGLLGTILDGFVFWAIIRPYHRLKAGEVQAVNMTASCLNYAPVRLGTVFRIVYHARVDRVPLIPIFAWFAAITVTTLACMGSVVAATVLTGGPGAVWAIALGGFLAVSGIVLWGLARAPFIRRRAGGIERMFGDPRALVAALVGRLLVLANGAVRLGVAAVILDIALGPAEVILLSVAALMLSFNPLGRFGWREATVAFVTAQFASGAFEGQDVDAVAAQLALVESAGEALVIIPLGIVTGLWSGARLLRSRGETSVTTTPG